MRTGKVYGKGKYFSHILVSYLCFVIIMLISSFLILKNSDQHQIKQTTRSNYAAFEQFYQIMDHELQNASDRISELNYDYQNFLYWLEKANTDSQPEYSIYRVTRRLQISKNNSMSDLLIYMPLNNKVVSTYHASLSPVDYFSTYYMDFDFSHLFQHSHTPYDLISVTTARGRKTLALKSYIYLSEEYPTLCVLNDDSLAKRVKNLEQSTGGYVMILSQDNEILLCSDSVNQMNVSSLTLDPGVSSQKIDEIPYKVFISESTIFPGKYISMVPLEIMHQSFSYYRKYNLISILLFSVFGLLLALFLTKVNYKPVAHLMKSMIPLNDPKNFPGASEFKYLEESVQSAIQEKEQFSSHIAELQHAQQNRFVFNLINGFIPSDSSMDLLFQKTDDNPLSSRFAVMVFNVEDWDETRYPRESMEERPHLSSVIFPNVIEELCNEKNHGFVISTKPDQYICLMNLAESTKTEDLKKIVEQALEFFNQQMGIFCTAGIGNIYSVLKGIRQSYNEALRAQEYKVAFGIGRAYCYSELPEANHSYNYSDNASVHMLLIQALQNESPNFGQIFDSIHSSCFNNHQPGTPEIIRHFILNLCIQVNSILKELDTRNKLNLMNHQFDLNLDTYKTLDDFREYFIRRMEDIHQEYLEHHTVKSLGRNIQDYIEENYSNCNLDVNEIGAHFNLSPTYCSKIFKQETNQSLLESINQFRVKKSCEKLLKTDENLESIAQDCGFSSSNVFIRNFKKMYGVTPGSYRRLLKP